MDVFTNHFRTIIFVDNYYAPFIVSVGSLGNFILLLVFSASRIRSHWSSAYFVAISASMCVFNALLALNYVGVWHYVDLIAFDGWCPLESYLMRVAELLPVTCAFGYSVEVAVFARNPVTHLGLFTRSARKRRWAVALIAFPFLVSAYTLFVTGVDDEDGSCTHLKSHYDAVRILFTVESAVAVFLPGACVFALAVFTAVHLRRINRYSLNWRAVNAAKIHQAKHNSRLQARGTVTSLPKGRLSTVPEETPVDIHDWNGPTMYPQMKHGTLVTSSVLICLLTIPYNMIRIYITWRGIDTRLLAFIGIVFAHLLFYTQFWILFLLCFVCDRMFRKILCQSCSC